MKLRNRLFEKVAVLALVFGLASVTITSNAVAGFPEKPINIWVGFSAGGSAHTISTLIAKELKKTLGQPIVVTVKSGGAGSVMAAQLAKVKPDGYTLGVAVMDTWAFMPLVSKKASYEIGDFTYLGTLTTGSPCFYVKADSPWKTFNDLIESAKTAQEPIKFVSLAPSVTLQFKSITKQAGVLNKFSIVTARGSSRAVPMILGGHADLGWGGGGHNKYVSKGKLRNLVITDKSHMADFPDLPTLVDLGYVGFPTGFKLIAGPKGIPADITKVLAGAIEKAVNVPDVVKIMKNFNDPVEYNSPDVTKKEIYSQTDYFRNLLAEFGKKKKIGQ
ncbi:MAG: tripartite tricarboxylate transporter substrate binding protein [Deltaproteobacteria bacterium]|nr:tripartite tricarboxylate transporter substrate binding protein [Deltaproteobacteria bacterium]